MVRRLTLVVLSSFALVAATACKAPPPAQEVDAGAAPKEAACSDSEACIVGALEKLAVADLAGAKLGLRKTSWEVATFEVPTDGPTDPETLRQRAKALQADAAKATGSPALGVWIAFKNGVVATAYFHPSNPTKLLLGGGPKDHLEWIRSQYEVELAGGAFLQRDPGTHGLMMWVCSGTLKNTGATPAKLEVRCPGAGLNQRVATTPETIAPGATGKFDVIAGPALGGERVEVEVLRGGEVVPYFDTGTTK